MVRWWLCLVVVSMVSFATSPLSAEELGGNEEERSGDGVLLEEWDKPPTYRRFQRNFPRQHDRGLLLRLEGGAAVVTPTEWEDAGWTGTGQIVLGGLPWVGLALHGSAWGWMAGSTGAAGVGPGVTYWFDELGGWFASLSAGVVHPLKSGGDGLHLKLGGEAQIGWHGWVSDTWSIGGSLSVGGEAGEIVAPEDGETWDRGRLSIRIGVSWN